jgi:hypothetical protein
VNVQAKKTCKGKSAEHHVKNSVQITLCIKSVRAQFGNSVQRMCALHSECGTECIAQCAGKVCRGSLQKKACRGKCAKASE